MKEKELKDKPTLPVRFAATRLLCPVPPAVDTTGTTEADEGVFLYSAVANRTGLILNTSETLVSAPPVPLLARPRPCCTAVLSF